jgi:predicted Zn-dependent protease
MRARIPILCMAALVAAPAFADRQPGEPPHPGWNLFSKQQDVQLGQEAAQQVRQQAQVVQDPVINDYVRRVGERLAATPQARNSGFQFTFTVLNDAQVNAFALPGGPMFIYTGLLKAVDNEAELAGVMGHEMSHVILRHGTHEISKAKPIELGAGLLAALVGNQSMMGQLTDLGLNLGANGVILKFSRDAESEADALGARIMAEAGYNPIEMANFFKKLESSGGQGNSKLAQFLSDHPNPGNREAAIQQEAATLPNQNYGYETGGFGQMKAELEKLPPPPPPKTQPAQ